MTVLSHITWIFRNRSFQTLEPLWHLPYSEHLLLQWLQVSWCKYCTDIFILNFYHHFGIIWHFCAHSCSISFLFSKWNLLFLMKLAAVTSAEWCISCTNFHFLSVWCLGPLYQQPILSLFCPYFRLGSTLFHW